MDTLNSLRATLAIVIIFFFTHTAHAVTLDFSAYSYGDTGLSSLSVGDATFDVMDGGTVFTYGPGDMGFFDYGGICALNASAFNCETDWTLTFDYAVTNLVFESAGYHTGDFVSIEAFYGTTSLGTIDVLGNGISDFGGAAITSLYFTDSSTGWGFAFGDFSYDRAAVPEVGSLVLLATGLLGLGIRRRKRSY